MQLWLHVISWHSLFKNRKDGMGGEGYLGTGWHAHGSCLDWLYKKAFVSNECSRNRHTGQNDIHGLIKKKFRIQVNSWQLS